MAQLNIGDPAPDFALADQEGNTVKLSDFQGKKLLFYFYPKADTPGCTKQACQIRDARSELADLGVDAVGISPDQPGAQKKFDGKYGLGFPLLSDPDHVAAQAYGAWGEKNLYGKKSMGIIRSSFLIDAQGKIMGTWYKVKPEDTVPLAEQALASK
ncbi:MAG: thioredoxin-dependent thiol peroxidase [Thermodesulfobacteriota bacterium]